MTRLGTISLFNSNRNHQGSIALIQFPDYIVQLGSTEGMQRQNVNTPHPGKKDSRTPARLTFSIQSILINWPPYSSPAGLQGYQ